MEDQGPIIPSHPEAALVASVVRCLTIMKVRVRVRVRVRIRVQG